MYIYGALIHASLLLASSFNFTPTVPLCIHQPSLPPPLSVLAMVSRRRRTKKAQLLHQVRLAEDAEMRSRREEKRLVRRKARSARLQIKVEDDSLANAFVSIYPISCFLHMLVLTFSPVQCRALSRLVQRSRKCL